jgi:2',3'-cyclic-nucleotide 2'-phosphodiesterase (5'-nucleotidase family)
MITRRLLLWVLLGLVPALAQDSVKPLTILHSNDLHAHLLPGDRDQGGFARLATAVRREKANCVSCLYLNAGDLVQGTPVSTLFHGTPVYQIANLLGIDISTLGNHEFDYGWRRVREFNRIAKYPLLSANVVDAAGNSITGRPYVIRTVGGIRVAVIGVILGNLVGEMVTAPQVGPWKVLPVVETVRKYAAELRNRSDIIVVLGHIRDKEEVDAILHQVPDVAVVVAGHSHVSYPSMVNVDGRVAVLVQSYGAELGRLDLKVDTSARKVRSAEWSKIKIDGKFAPAPDVEKQVKYWEAKVTKIVDTPIGESKKRIASRDELRPLLEKAMAEQVGADIAWINRGNIRDELPEGTILARHIWNIFPFDNYVVTGKFKGSQLPSAITSRYPVDPEREYTVATTDFTAANQASSDQLGATGLVFPNTGPLQRDAVIEWIKKKKIIP